MTNIKLLFIAIAFLLYIVKIFYNIFEIHKGLKILIAHGIKFV